VIPAGRTLYVSPEVAAFRSRTASPKAGENHFVQGNYDGQLSARGGTVELVDASNRVVSTLAYAGAPTLLQQGLRLSEVMYHPAPAPGGPFEDEDFEFIELKNISRQPLNLLGATFNEGVTFTFTNVATSTLAPGARVLIVRRLAAFVSRYGNNLPVAGEYLGALHNSGESLRLQDAQGETVFEFRYEDSWFTNTDGDGFSLEPVSPDADLDLASSWRPSRQIGGSPGRTSWPAFVEQISLVGDTVQIKARAEAGNSYQLQGILNLTGSSWIPLTPPQTGSEDFVLQFDAPLSADPARFLRVGQP
jgi:hypothetical protein